MNKMNDTERNHIEVTETDLEQVTGGGYFWEYMQKGSQAVKDRLAELGLDFTDTSKDVGIVDKFTQK